MTDPALANALARQNAISLELASLDKRMAELKEELTRVGVFIDAWHEFAEAKPIGLQSEKENDIAPAGFRRFTLDRARLDRAAALVSGGKIRRATNNPKKEDVAEAARRIIQDRGEPVSRTDLFKELAERGFVITSETDPEMVLSTMLWRMKDKIIRVKSGGYWLTGVPNEEAGYSGHTTEMEQVQNTPPEEWPSHDQIQIEKQEFE